ncbi:hypothetical protein D3C75_1177370 [compost metagenome]
METECRTAGGLAELAGAAEDGTAKSPCAEGTAEATGVGRALELDKPGETVRAAEASAEG